MTDPEFSAIQQYYGCRKGCTLVTFSSEDMRNEHEQMAHEDVMEAGSATPVARHSSNETGTRTVYVTIGNSDDRLSQQDWMGFINSVRAWLKHSIVIHFTGFSNSDDPWQNAMFSFEIKAGQVMALREFLRKLAREYGQNSIALAVVEDVELVEP
jgi:hypothetical protein